MAVSSGQHKEMKDRDRRKQQSDQKQYELLKTRFLGAKLLRHRVSM
uniref:Uncharacterized protein n=1 Tax=Arundo donax TaxID=35708 RepID=A0A0A9GEL8_ARUDO